MLPAILQRELKDPRIGLITVTRVDLTRDLRHAKIYVSMLGDAEQREGTMEALRGATGFVRRQLASRLALRVSPEIVFVYDPSVEYGIRLEALIDETKERSPAEPEEAEDGASEAPPSDETE